MLTFLVFLLVASAVLYLSDKELLAQVCFSTFLILFVYSVVTMAAENHNARIRDKAQFKAQTETALRQVHDTAAEVQQLRAEMRGEFVELRAAINVMEMALESDVCLDNGASR